MCTLLLFPFCAALCSSSISHITLTLVSPQSSPRSFITVSLKRWLGSLECHGNAVPQCVYTHSCICIFWCVCVWVCHVFESIHACVFLFWGSYCFFFFTQKAPEIWRCVAAVTEKRRDSASRQRAVGRIQEELRSSNRQRAKRMTVPSSSRSVNTIIFEPGFRSKTRHTICKTVTKGKLHWLTELHGKEQTQPSQLWINSLKIQHNEIMKIKCSPGRYKQRIAHQQLCCSLVQYGSELPGKYPYEGMNRKSLLPKCDLPLLFFQLTSASSISQNKARWYQS